MMKLNKKKTDRNKPQFINTNDEIIFLVQLLAEEAIMETVMVNEYSLVMYYYAPVEHD